MCLAGTITCSMKGCEVSRPSATEVDPGVLVGTGFDEDANYLVHASERGRVERATPRDSLSAVRVGARSKEQLQHVFVSAFHGEMERSRTCRKRQDLTDSAFHSVSIRRPKRPTRTAFSWKPAEISCTLEPAVEVKSTSKYPQLEWLVGGLRLRIQLYYQQVIDPINFRVCKGRR